MITSTQRLQAVSFLDMLGAGLIVPQLPNQARLLGCSHLLIGVIGAVYNSSQLVSGPVIGSLSDLKGRKPTLLLSLILCSIAYSLLGVTTSVATFFALRASLGLFKQTQLLTKSMTPDYESDPKKQAVEFGRLVTLSGLGMSMGPMIGGHIIEAFPEYGFTIIAFIVGGLFAVNIGLANSLPNKKNKTDQNQNKKKTKKAEAPKILDSLKSSVKESINEFSKVDWAIYWDVFLFKLLITLCMGVYFTNYALFLKTQHGMSPTSLGYIIAFLGGIGSASTYFIGYINKLYKDDKDSTVRTFHVFVGITLSLIGMGLSPNVYFYLACVVPFSVAGSVARVSSLEMIVSRGKTEHRGSVIGASSSMRSVAGVVCPLLTGVVSQYIGVPYVIFVAALFGAVGIVVSYRIKNNPAVSKSKSD